MPLLWFNALHAMLKLEKQLPLPLCMVDAHCPDIVCEDHDLSTPSLDNICDARLEGQ
jgi:hypothetical protein